MCACGESVFVCNVSVRCVVRGRGVMSVCGERERFFL